jgi:hypothetical protein
MSLSGPFRSKSFWPFPRLRIESLLDDVLALADEEPDLIGDVLGDLLDGFVLTVLVIRS